MQSTNFISCYPAFSFLYSFFFHTLKKLPFPFRSQICLLLIECQKNQDNGILAVDTFTKLLTVKRCFVPKRSNFSMKIMKSTYKIGCISILARLIFNSVDLFLNDRSLLLLNDFIKRRRVFVHRQLTIVRNCFSSRFYSLMARRNKSQRRRKQFMIENRIALEGAVRTRKIFLK